jgi:uncharacterized LabA/DUF88 family protein
MTRDTRDLNIALFIDFENLVTRTGITPESFDLQPALDRLIGRGKVVFRRAYADWSRFGAARPHLHDHGVELIDVPPSTRAGKNAADIRLVIDALELAYQRGHVDAFAIASGDSDFCPLAYKLREIGRTVIGLAVREASSPLFVKACDEFVYFAPNAPRPARAEREATADKSAEKSADKSAEKSEEKPPAKPAKPARKAREPKPKAPEPKGPSIPAVAQEAAGLLFADAAEPVNQSALMNFIVRKEPDFDVKEHGFSSFSRLVEAMEKEGILKRRQSERGQWYVMPA